MHLSSHSADPAQRPLRVLYSYPHKIGASRICYAAWQHVQGLINSGAEVHVHPGVLQRPFTGPVSVHPTLARGRLRIPYRVLGRTGACNLHDWIVARRLRRLVGKIDLVHTFPLGSLRTLRTARQLGIPAFLERCNAHTEYAYSIVQKECDRIGVQMPIGHEHSFNPRYLRREEAEYQAAQFLLCPSTFVMRTFTERGFPPEKLVRFRYGFDPAACYPPREPRPEGRGLTVLFAAGCAPRKGLHLALEAWMRSTAHQDGTFLVAGEFIPNYAERLADMLGHPSVKRIGFRNDLPEVMRSADILVLPSIEEGSALVTYDARGCGCVLLVSDASGAVCEDNVNALVHPAGDVATLAEHLTRLHQDRALLRRLREASLATAQELTWAAAGPALHESYREALGRGRGAGTSQPAGLPTTSIR